MSRVAVVTGAAGGIGAATCAVLEEQGWSVVPVDREPVDHPAALRLDLADAAAVQEALKALPRVDGLVNNAALQLFRPLGEIGLADWDEVFAVNLRGAFACLQALRPRLAQARGAVVNVASVHALATSAQASGYAATKGGLMAFTRAAAVELAGEGIRVNAVLPGAVETPALRAGLDRAPGARETLVARTPLGRVGEPREIGEAIAFLLDGGRSSFITGQGLVADGGALARLSTE